jgi:hypothetical protein
MARRQKNDYLTSLGFGFLWIVLMLTGLLSGCSRPNPTPELKDPIYLDLVKRGAVASAASELAKEELKTLKSDLETLPPRDSNRRKLQQDLTRKETHLMVADQEALYFEIRAQQRKDFARTEYLESFNAGKPWPVPEDFEAYKAQRRLQDAPREWQSRLKKSDRYNKKSADDIRDELDERLKTTK